MKLIRTRVSNFKGVSDFTLETGGASISLYGRNYLGKSTVGADAFFYCLFHKDSRGQSDAKFDPKPIDPFTGEPIHNVESVVEVTLDQDTFRKTYREVYTQKRGSTTSEFTGHETAYHVNGVPVKEGEYNAEVARLCPERTFRLLTDPTYFASIKWEERRAMLMSAFAADVTDAIVIKYSHELADLPAIIGRHSVDDYRKIADARRRAINDAQKTIPARIDELNRQLKAADDPDTRGFDMANLRLKLSTAQRDKANLEGGAGGGAKLAAELAAAELAVDRYVAARQREHEQSMDGHRANRRQKANAVAEAKQSVVDLKRKYDSDEREYARLEAELKRLREARRALKAETFGGSTVCPTCERPLAAEAVEAARAQWNENHARRLEEDAATGKPFSEKVEAMRKGLESLCAQIIEAEEKADRLQAILDNLPADPEFALDTSAADYCALVAKRDRLRQEQASGGNDDNTAAAIREIDTVIEGLQEGIVDAEKAAQARAARQSTEKRIKELADEEKALATEYETLMRNIGLCEAFVRAKCSLLTDRVNDHFTMANFKLFKQQINGGIVDCCEIMLDGRTWPNMSTSERINTGLDIINAFTTALGADPMPIIIDNCEAVSSPLPTFGQQIRLIVSESDTEFRIVPDGEPVVAEAKQEALF